MKTGISAAKQIYLQKGDRSNSASSTLYMEGAEGPAVATPIKETQKNPKKKTRRKTRSAKEFSNMVSGNYENREP